MSFNIEKNKASATSLQVSPLDSVDNVRFLRALSDLLGACVGPEGRLHMVQSAAGGHVTLTSDSRRLLAATSLSRQVVKLIVSSVQGHLAEFGDGGKFLSSACLQLVILTLQASEGFSNRAAWCSLYELFVKIVCDYLNSEVCAVCVKADLTDVNVLLAYVNSVLSSRSLLNLDNNDCGKLSELIIQCFVQSIPDNSQLCSDLPTRLSDGINFVDHPSVHIRESHLLNGVLLKCHDIPHLKGPLHLDIKTSISKTKHENYTEINPDLNKCIKVCVVKCSMSGDLEDVSTATFEVTPEQVASATDCAINKLSEFCQSVAACEVGLLLCQKVIHPRIKILLKSLGVLAVERLGSALIPYILDLTGARPVMSVTSVADVQSYLGEVTTVQHVVQNNRSYLHLEHPSSVFPVVSLVLSSKTEESLEEFKSCAKSSLRGLFSLLKEGKLLAGAGCWQTHCSFVLLEKVQERLSEIASSVGCSESQVLSALTVFRRAVFHHWIYLVHSGQGWAGADALATDTRHRHCWVQPPNILARPPEEQKIKNCCCKLKSTLDQDSLKKLDLQHISKRNPRITQKHIKTDFEGNTLRSQSASSICASSVEKDLIDEEKIIPLDKSDVPSNEKGSRYPRSQKHFDNAVTKDTVLDHFSASLQALYKSVFTANLVLSLGQIISDS